MYFLWRGKPRSVLGNNCEWIPAQEIESRIDGIMVFSTAEGARNIQKKDFSKENVSVINKKTFQQKTKMRKLPGFKTIPADIDIKPQEPKSRFILLTTSILFAPWRNQAIAPLYSRLRI